ncbi:recombinase RecF, partial [Pseudomonas viridiflava]|uniref:recombinase RecF n=1 Tax=Pseudomonas viridiflava TaxID=33069 RepID=UPI000F042E31
LEQGQNQLLHTRVDKRKEALNNLFNISDVKEETDNCKAIALRLTKFLSDPKRAAESSKLKTESALLKGMIQAALGAIEYKKISTAELQPGWDKESPFPTYYTEIHADFVKSIQRLQSLVPLKGAIRIRDKNDSIENYIELNKNSVKILARFGSDLSTLDGLDLIKNELNVLTKAGGIIKRGATVVKSDEATSLSGWAPGRLDWFQEQIVRRDALQQKSTTSASAAAELNRLKADLMAEHAKLNANDQHCPLCGADWQAHDIMLQKIELRSNQINNALSADGQTLLTLAGLMTAELALIEAQIKAREAQISAGYNSALHNALLRDKARLPAVAQLAARLNVLGVQFDYALTDKELFIAAKANEAQSTRLKQCLNELQVIQRENEAAKVAKDKVNNLKATLEKTERNYSEQTIAEIELIFHIYSGRLIQNYQRGLGLFIESKDGKELKFLTAEKSEHDAILSMSSGQVSALSLGFFLSLNRVYSTVPLILIDDPSQSLDEVNIASLTDLLRCEFNNRQLIVSSHEDDISAYMRYRFNKAGLSTRSLNMQRLAKDALATAD